MQIWGAPGIEVDRTRGRKLGADDTGIESAVLHVKLLLFLWGDSFVLHFDYCGIYCGIMGNVGCAGGCRFGN